MVHVNDGSAGPPWAEHPSGRILIPNNCYTYATVGSGRLGFARMKFAFPFCDRDTPAGRFPADRAPEVGVRRLPHTSPRGCCRLVAPPETTTGRYHLGSQRVGPSRPPKSTTMMTPNDLLERRRSDRPAASASRACFLTVPVIAPRTFRQRPDPELRALPSSIGYDWDQPEPARPKPVPERMPDIPGPGVEDGPSRTRRSSSSMSISKPQPPRRFGRKRDR